MYLKYLFFFRTTKWLKQVKKRRIIKSSRKVPSQQLYDFQRLPVKALYNHGYLDA